MSRLAPAGMAVITFCLSTHLTQYNSIMKAVSAIIGASLLSSASAFAPTHQSRANVALKASNDDVDFFDPLNLSEEKTSAIPFAATAAATFALHPLVAMAG